MYTRSTLTSPLTDFEPKVPKVPLRIKLVKIVPGTVASKRQSVEFVFQPSVEISVPLDSWLFLQASQLCPLRKSLMKPIYLFKKDVFQWRTYRATPGK
jgi:hypothetical protein